MKLPQAEEARAGSEAAASKERMKERTPRVDWADQVWQLTAANTLSRMADLTASAARLATTVPASSVTLFVVPGTSPYRQEPGASLEEQ